MILLNEFYSSPSEQYQQEEKEKNGIRYIGKIAGRCIIGYVLIQNILSILLFSGPLGRLYDTDPDFQSVATIFFSLSSILIPFGVGGYYISKRTKTDVFNLGKPVSNSLMLSAVPFGFFICLAGNYVTSLFVNFMDEIGIHLTAPDFDVPSGLGGRLIYIVSIAVVPPLVEEFAIRGVIMQPLRKYGDKFAILASALVFAVLHGNLIQAPFALIAGIGIGYAVCLTNSVWTGVLIHAVNNFYSVITEFMIEDITDEAMLERVYLITTVLLYAVSILGSVLFIIIRKRRRAMPSFTSLSEGRKMLSFTWNIPMVIALIIMFYLTKSFIELS